MQTVCRENQGDWITLEIKTKLVFFLFVVNMIRKAMIATF